MVGKRPVRGDIQGDGTTPTKGKNMAPHLTVQVFSRHLLLKTKVSTGDNDLEHYERELAEARRFIGKVANKALAALENFGRSGSTLNVGITPSTGEVGVVIEVSKGDGLTATECEKLTEMLKV
jgi:hypothetical protein